MHFCCAVQLNTSTVVDSAVLSGHISVFQPFVGRETAVLIYSAIYGSRAEWVLILVLSLSLQLQTFSVVANFQHFALFSRQLPHIEHHNSPSSCVLMIAFDISYLALAEPQVRTEYIPFHVLELMQEKITLRSVPRPTFF